MILAGALAYGRGQAEARFTERFTFFTAARGVDPNTLEDTMVETVRYANVPGMVKYPSATVSESMAAGQSFSEQDVQARVAVGATPLVVTDDLCRVVSSLADAGLVSKVFRVKGAPQGGQVTAHRYPVEELS